MSQKKFIHLEARNKTKAPGEIIPVVMELVKPASIVDIGCGTGSFLNFFKQYGVKEVLGIDGSWVNKKLLYENLTEAEFLEKDLEQLAFRDVNKKFDLVLCLEVAEHLSPASADGLVKNLISFGDAVLFSAAIPYQEGQNHINEQWIEYWQEKFKVHDFIFNDVIRSKIWKNANVPYWFQQNLFLITRKNHKGDYEQLNMEAAPVMNYVHPELYLKKAKKLDTIIRGHYPLTGYIKLFATACLSRLKIRK